MSENKVCCSYSIQGRIAAILLLGDWVAKLPGANSHAVMNATLSCIETNTGLDLKSLRGALPTGPGIEKPPSDDKPFRRTPLTTEQLANKMNTSLDAMNSLLEERGFQARNDAGEWELTKTGELWGRMAPRFGTTPRQPLWDLHLITGLRYV
jgi:hypothetical protein